MRGGLSSIEVSFPCCIKEKECADYCIFVLYIIYCNEEVAYTNACVLLALVQLLTSSKFSVLYICIYTITPIQLAQNTYSLVNTRPTKGSEKVTE